ncbi:MAG TPA: sigma-70 family RNA polymerase sigma factor [Candidatus Acidoferrales bacterium]|nr:sigma-70 family RNA polymerase sigma factor [Candidatus Acidoferrales bacterium]
MTIPLAEGDERLMVEAAQRDPRLFAELYERHFERIYSYVARRVRDRASAEDVTADVFHQALKNLPRFEWRGAPFAAWLYRIAANAIADRARKVARESAEPAPEQAAPAPDPARDTAWEESERRGRIFCLVRELPADQRRVLVGRFAEERSIREIAAELGRSEGAVKQLQFRALAALREGMSEDHG